MQAAMQRRRAMSILTKVEITMMRKLEEWRRR
jgi:hypothetical protein